ncbi:hypothetical protein CHUAL_006613 [Chamberlinius hualienensis]
MAFYNFGQADGSVGTQSNNKLWIFGYGSLLWNPGFQYQDTVIGCVRGYSRKFWQGNTVHRGTPQNPGRVATLVKDPEELTWGRAYEPCESEMSKSFSYLDRRECQLGGYETTIAQFYPKDPKRKPFPVLLYIGKESSSESYLGPASMTELARQIVSAKGNCGTNVEYIVRLADFMREWFPEIFDEHLYTLEDHVKTEIKRNNLDLNRMMGSVTLNEKVEAAADVQNNNNDNHRSVQRSLFTERVAPNKLRCVKI